MLEVTEKQAQELQHIDLHVSEPWAVVEAVRVIKAVARLHKLEAQVGEVTVMFDVGVLGTDERLAERWESVRTELKERGFDLIITR